jgi:hypothetical protein
VSLLTDLDVFFTEHGRCDDLDAGVNGEIVWIDCDCGAALSAALGAARSPHQRSCA